MPLASEEIRAKGTKDICKRCKQPFTLKRKDQVFCKYECRQEYWSEFYGEIANYVKEQRKSRIEELTN